jgi:outer membrane protein OmpA-like peptidoglycan-associated protein
VDSVGCPLDSDGDGVADYLDQCANTPKEAIGKIDSVGCPLDSDGDGVADYLDKCANTPKEAIGKTDSVGCPLDSDGDGIYDYEDKCPNLAGVKDNFGCPEVKAEVKQLFKKALNGIQFASGKATIMKRSYPILNDVVKVMKENPTYNLSIVGHTDSSGDSEKNLKLSQDRAASVKDYLIMKGVDASRIRTDGKGDTEPVADNETVQGRTLNRRVAFEIEYME